MAIKHTPIDGLILDPPEGDPTDNSPDGMETGVDCLYDGATCAWCSMETYGGISVGLDLGSTKNVYYIKFFGHWGPNYIVDRWVSGSDGPIKVYKSNDGIYWTEIHSESAPVLFNKTTHCADFRLTFSVPHYARYFKVWSTNDLKWEDAGLNEQEAISPAELEAWGDLTDPLNLNLYIDGETWKSHSAHARLEVEIAHYPHHLDLYFDTETWKPLSPNLDLDTQIAKEHWEDFYLEVEFLKPHIGDVYLDTQIKFPQRFIFQLDTEITRRSQIWGYVKDWRNHIVRKKCKIIISSLDGSIIYAVVESDPETGYFFINIGVEKGTSVVLNCFYEGSFRGQINLAGNLIKETSSSSSSLSSSSSSSSLSSSSFSSSSCSFSSSSSSSFDCSGDPYSCLSCEACEDAGYYWIDVECKEQDECSWNGTSEDCEFHEGCSWYDYACHYDMGCGGGGP